MVHSFCFMLDSMTATHDDFIDDEYFYEKYKAQRKP